MVVIFRIIHTSHASTRGSTLSLPATWDFSHPIWVLLRVCAHFARISQSHVDYQNVVRLHENYIFHFFGYHAWKSQSNPPGVSNCHIIFHFQRAAFSWNCRHSNGMSKFLKFPTNNQRSFINFSLNILVITGYVMCLIKMLMDNYVSRSSQLLEILLM